MEGEGAWLMATSTGATDSTVEQRLEVEGRCGMVNLFIGKRRHNDEEATAAAMRNGCS